MRWPSMWKEVVRYRPLSARCCNRAKVGARSEGTNIQSLPIAHPAQVEVTAGASFPLAYSTAVLCWLLSAGVYIAAKSAGCRNASLGALLLAACARLRDPFAGRASSSRRDDRADPVTVGGSSHHRSHRPDALPRHDLYRP